MPIEAVATPHVVVGRITDGRGRPLAGATIAIAERQGRRLVERGLGTSSARGDFRVSYVPNSLPPDLRVEARVGGRVVDVVSVEDAEPEQSVHLRANRPETDAPVAFERIRAALHLHVTDDELNALSPEEITYLVNKTRLPRAEVSRYVRAIQLAAETEMDASLLFAVLVELPKATSASLLATPSERLTQALRRAEAARVIASSGAPEDRVRALRKKLVARRPVRVATELGAILDALRLDDGVQTLVLDAASTIDEAARALPSLASRIAPDAQTLLAEALGFAQKVDRDPVVVAAIATRRSSWRDVAAWEEREWLALLTTAGVPARAAAERALRLRQRVEELLPDESFRAHLDRSSRPSAQRVGRYLAAHPSFSFVKDDLEEQLRRHPLDASEADELRAVRRLWSVVPRTARHAAIETLRAAGFATASAIASEEREQFVAAHALALGGRDRALDIWHLSTARASEMLVELGRVFDRIGDRPAVLGASDPADWEALFGHETSCCCEHCASLLSPAAYLVDLFEFLLRGTKNARGESPLDVLFARRLDFGHLTLSCENTLTPVPTIDFVNEILESVVLEGMAAPQARQTVAAEGPPLLPEHTNPAAYTKLAGAPFPWGLADVVGQSIDAWLGAVGITRRQLIDAREVAGRTLTGAALRIGVSLPTAQLLAGERAVEHPADVWGVSRAGWIDTLSALPRFLAASRLELETLNQALATPMLAGPRIDWGDEPCSLEHAKLRGLDEAWLRRAHSFLRLRDALGWAPAVLDCAWRVLDGDRGAPFLIDVSLVVDLAERFALPLPEVLAWFGPLARAPWQSQFVEPGLRLVSNRDEVEAQGESALPYASQIAACIGVAVSDLTPILETERTTLSIESLSSLFRRASIARAARIPITELSRVVVMSGLDPFASPASATHFLDAMQQAGTSGLSLGTLLEIFVSPPPPSDAAVANATSLISHLAVVGASLSEPARTVAELAAGADWLAASAGFDRELVLPLLRIAELRDTSPVRLAASLARVANAVRLIASLELGPSLFAWLVENAPQHRWIDLFALPVHGGSATSSQFSRWLSLRALLSPAIRRGRSSDEMLAWLRTQESIDERELLAARRVEEIASRAGIPSDDLRILLDEGTPDAASRVVRTRVGNERWADVARPIANRLREVRRDALLRFAIASLPHGATAKTLHDYYLIDFEVGACQLGSRVQAAIAAVQLFVQRALLGLEPLALSDADRRRWNVLAHYRVWEADRKVFFWPENWLRPELRREKSSLFIEAERDVQKRSLDGSPLEPAVMRYAERLAEVGRCELLALYQERPPEGFRSPPDGRAPLHLFARTQNEPRSYLHRTRLASGFWTPWRPIDAGIEGDYLIAGRVQGQLALFWPVFEEESVPSGDRMLRWYEFQIATTRLTEVGWSPKEMSASALNRHGHPTGNGAFELKSVGSTLKDAEYETHFRLAAGDIECRRMLADYEDGDCSYVDLGRFRPFDAGRHLVPKQNRLANSGMPRDVEGLWSPFVEARGTTFRERTDTNGGAPLDVTAAEVDVEGHATSPPATIRVFGNAIAERVYQLILPQQFGFEPFACQTAFAYQDEEHTFLLDPVRDVDGERAFRVELHQDPYASRFANTIAEAEIETLFDLDRVPVPAAGWFESEYPPVARLVSPPSKALDFSLQGAYSGYHWELFYHLPFFIATRLTAAGRFEAARRWFHLVFDPTRQDGDAPARYWRLPPFREPQAGDTAGELAAWRDNPFDPHAIARTRPTAYQKAIVLAYVEHLLAWGDSLFRVDTLEAVVEATNLYLLALELLGPKRACVRGSTPQTKPTWFSLTLTAWIERFELRLPLGGGLWQAPTNRSTDTRPFSLRPDLFCMPRNERLAHLRETVEDRLYKLRHCLDIEGNPRQLPLFAAPIDPATLVAAAASSNGALSSYAEPPLVECHYRFAILIRRAVEYATTAKELGRELLSAIERGDGEALQRLRTSHEEALLDEVRAGIETRIAEATILVRAANDARNAVRTRSRHYQRLVAADGPLFLSTTEQRAIDARKTSRDLTLSAKALEAASATFYVIPQFMVEAGFPPSFTTETGGRAWGDSTRATAAVIAAFAAWQDAEAGDAERISTYERRAQDWRAQAEALVHDVANTDKQLAAAEARLQIAREELAQHERRRRQAAEVREILETKFSRTELYQFLEEELMQLHAEALDVAYQMSRRAQTAFGFEVPDGQSSFLPPRGVTAPRNRLVAADALLAALRRMDAAYLDRNRRKLELTRVVSLARLDPQALLSLRNTGEARFELPEGLYDHDYPGHFQRRLVSVAITIPAVTGPLRGVNATLTLERSKIRLSADTNAGYAESPLGADPRFRYDLLPAQSIVTSSAQSDFGATADGERYMPFEGAGAISSWRIDLPQRTNELDLATVTDVILEVRYTAAANPLLKELVDREIVLAPTMGATLISARHQLADSWQQFLRGSGERVLDLDLSRRRFPFLAGKKELMIESVQLFLEVEGETNPLRLRLADPLGNRIGEPDADLVNVDGVMRVDFANLRVPSHETTAPWRLVLALPAATLARNLWIVARYTTAR